MFGDRTQRCGRITAMPSPAVVAAHSSTLGAGWRVAFVFMDTVVFYRWLGTLTTSTCSSTEQLYASSSTPLVLPSFQTSARCNTAHREASDRHVCARHWCPRRRCLRASGVMCAWSRTRAFSAERFGELRSKSALVMRILPGQSTALQSAWPALQSALQSCAPHTYHTYPCAW